jgi:ribosomal protein S27E
VPERNDVSFKSREKKRRYKAAVKKSKQRHAPETARRWFLTIARKPGACARCGDKLAGGAEVVYRHEPREVRCLRCADRLEDSKGYRPSLRWERARRVPPAVRG